MASCALSVNGQSQRLEVAPGAMLLDVLRDGLGLTGAKDACRRGECGACTVLVGGRAVLSCVTLAELVSGPVETVEGLAEEARHFREAMADRGGFQCSYCTPGMVVRAVSLLRAGLPANDAALAAALSGNLCRCTGYRPILAALREAAT
jgi:aerobic-type carbon monoxide dehydrogenase small subunit (CoxS/CutS family)